MLLFTKTENRKAKQVLSGGGFWGRVPVGAEERKEVQRVNMVQILCSHV
jgi:hypothetical protein